MDEQVWSGPVSSVEDRRAFQSIIHAPGDPSAWPEWRQGLADWRRGWMGLFGNGSMLEDDPARAWVSSSYASCLLPVWDETFFDPESASYRVTEFLDTADREFGGFDNVLLWQAYPRVGFDDRNQFDYLWEMPGAAAGLRDLADALHDRGVRVLLAYNPWDQGTRQDSRTDTQLIAEAVRAVDADGVFLDTMGWGDDALRAALEAIRPGLIWCVEEMIGTWDIHDHPMGWGEQSHDSAVPGVIRNKWIERRHMQYQIHRLRTDRTEDLHTAWMNGSGVVVWENVFGTPVPWSPRDRSILRSMLPILRRHADLFSGEGWMPLVPTEQPATYASLWEGRGLRLWTLVNRAESIVQGDLLSVSAAPGSRFVDLVAGSDADTRNVGSGLTYLSGSIQPRGIGCFLEISPVGEPGPDLEDFLERQAELERRADWNPASPSAAQVRVTPSADQSPTRSATSRGMIDVPGATLDLETRYQIREAGFIDEGRAGTTEPVHVDACAEWSASGLHTVGSIRRQVVLQLYAIDETPVTNGEYQAFLRATGYRPRHAERFLAHWIDGAPPPGLGDHPVVYVDLDDARAYASWAGKRLPTDEEWQWAAQGPDARAYPWGDEWLPGLCNDGSTGGTTPVRAFPGGRSTFGCYDMCGNTWEWTESVRTDGYTRFCILRSGSYYSTRADWLWVSGGGRWYRVEDSYWYADRGPQRADFASKFILYWAGLDRCANLGFRCAADKGT